MRSASLSFLVLAAVLSGCGVAPKSGPQSAAVIAGAEADGAMYDLRVLDAPTIASLQADHAARAAVDAKASRLRRDAPLLGAVLRPGDLVSVTIWEAVNGGLFSGATPDGPKSTRLPPQRVDAAGMIGAPYAGRLRAAGRTPDQVARALVGALAGKAIEPQAQVTVMESPGATVTVVGDAASQPGRVPLNGVGERLLDVIAAAGGVNTPSHEARVRLTRAGGAGEAWLDSILREPGQNVAMRPGDTLALMAQRRSYTVFGAARRPLMTPFPRANLTLDEAIATAAGLDDDRADPSAVFVFREAPGARKMVYNLDLSQPEAFFLARGFQMEDHDILFMANSPVTDLRKILSLVGEMLNPVGRTTALAGGL